MTSHCNIFYDKTTMPSGEMTELDTPVHVHQVPRAGSKSGAQSNMPLTVPMSVDNISRPRRGHDY
jgi:hypothetical protein